MGLESLSTQLKPKLESEHNRSSIEKFKAKALDYTRRALAAGLVLLGPSIALAENTKPTFQDTKQDVKIEPSKGYPKGVEVDFILLRAGLSRGAKNEQGELYNLPWYEIPLVTIDFATTSNENPTVSIPLHMDLAKQFNTADFSNQEELESLKSNIDQELKKEFVRQLSTLSFDNKSTEDVYRMFNEADLYSKMQIKSVNIVGSASPEGPSNRGSSTLRTVDKENESLAKLRAEKGYELFKENLQQHGVNIVDLDQKVSITAAEAQFTEEDNERIDKIIEMSQKFGLKGVNREEKLFSTIRLYNDGKIDRLNPGNSELVKSLQELLDSKRQVTIRVTFEGANQKDFVVAFPLLPLLLLLGAFAYGPKLEHKLRKRRLERESKLDKEEEEITKENLEQYRSGSLANRIYDYESEEFYAELNPDSTITMPDGRVMKVSEVPEGGQEEKIVNMTLWHHQGVQSAMVEKLRKDMGKVQADDFLNSGAKASWYAHNFSKEDQKTLEAAFKFANQFSSESLPKNPYERLYRFLTWYRDQKHKIEFKDKNVDPAFTITDEFIKDAFKPKQEIEITLTNDITNEVLRKVKVSVPVEVSMATARFHQKKEKVKKKILL
ncbi:MAG TPA: hypothetical protein VGO63_01410 [Candidatus Paceibacterota bacterium]|jgi:hypothetical protein|nr:hypothetical protein [Candidatus Paceibacterota bacterium]